MLFKKPLRYRALVMTNNILTHYWMCDCAIVQIQKVMVLPPFLYTRPLCFSCQTLTYNFGKNKIWVICHKKYIRKFFEMCIHSSNDILFMAYNSHFVGKINGQS